MGGKKYVEGDVDATIVGTAIMWEDANNVLRPVSAAKPLPMADGVTGAALGTTTDAAASAAVDEDATARTGISLWKGIKNLLIDIAGYLAGNLLALDAGPSQTITRTYTTSADMTAAADITPAPSGGEKIHAVDILVSSDTQMLFSVQMETSANVLAAVRLPADGTVQITLRGEIVADAADKKIQGKASAAGNVYITANTYSGS